MKHPSTYTWIETAIGPLAGGVSHVIEIFTTKVTSVYTESAAQAALKGCGSDILVM